MRRLLKLLFWGLVFVLLLVVVDQFLLRAAPVHPAHAALSEFYRDFRHRLQDVIGLPTPETPSIEAVIESEREAQAEQRTASAPESESDSAAAGAKYIYVDRYGVLQFADSRAEIPEAYRDSAEPLAE